MRVKKFKEKTNMATRVDPDLYFRHMPLNYSTYRNCKPIKRPYGRFQEKGVELRWYEQGQGNNGT